MGWAKKTARWDKKHWSSGVTYIRGLTVYNGHRRYKQGVAIYRWHQAITIFFFFFITWTNVNQDPWHHAVSLGHNELTNILRLGQDGRHFGRQRFQMLFHQWKYFNFELNFVPKGPNDDKSSLVQVMTWRWRGAKPNEPIMTQFDDAYMRWPVWVK